MPPPEAHAEVLEAATTLETSDTASAKKSRAPSENGGRSTVDRARERKLQRQRRMKQAWKKLVDSFDEVFYNSDEDNDDLGQDPYFPPRSPPQGYVDEGSRYPPPGRSYGDPYMSPPSRRTAADDYGKDVVGQSRSRSLPLPIDPDGTAPPISYVTELYDYSELSRRGEYEEAYLKSSFEKNVPANVFHARGADQTSVEGLVFKLVSMYAISHSNQHNRHRNRYNESIEHDQSDDYLRHAEKSLGVLAEVGTYMTIHSQAAIRALRFIIPAHPDLSRLAETVTVTEPFCFIVQYKREIAEYIATLPALPEPPAEPAPEPKFATKPAVRANSADAEMGREALGPMSVPLARVELTEEQQERHDLQMVMSSIFSNDFSRKHDAEIALHIQKKCTFELAWMLFRPGSYVYSWEGDSLNCFIVDSFELEGLFAKRTESSLAAVRPRIRRRGQDFDFSRVPESIVVKMSYLEFDGDYIGRRPKKVVISAFKGDKDINALPVFPVEYCTFENIRQALVDRGKKYLELTNRTYAEYDGETLSIPRRSVQSRIVIDSSTFYNDRDSGMTKAPKLIVPKEEGMISSECSSSDASDDSATSYRARRSIRSHKRKIRSLKRRPNRNMMLTEHDVLEPERTEFSDEQYMLFTHKVYGFILKERSWDLLDVSSVKQPMFQDDMINDLVLRDETKTLIQALSSSQAIAAGTDPYVQKTDARSTGATLWWSADFVQSKAAGRVFLLHGMPGVGKTTTAECVAEQSRSPLLSITCGDLGINPAEVEKNLMKWLKLATLWKAVVLLDDADVYLEARVSGDLQRNGIVSIFLRALEQYQGLLFLTTNRIGTFDEAFISRIHVVLHYPDFTDEQRKQLWSTSFRKLDEEREDIKIGSGLVEYAFDHEDVKRLRMNGRDIRNAFNTIVALAEFDAEKRRRAKPGDPKIAVIRLERSHLEQVVEMKGKFKEYMRRTKGMDESKFAHVARVRDGDIIADQRDPKRAYRS